MFEKLHTKLHTKARSRGSLKSASFASLSSKQWNLWSG
nr:MAG TPA: hypothetical protein [Caudoviricetes sp.]